MRAARARRWGAARSLRSDRRRRSARRRGRVPGGTAEGAPDLVEARGEIVELGTSARWELTFAEPLVMPDATGHPFRVDIAIHDPAVRGSRSATTAT